MKIIMHQILIIQNKKAWQGLFIPTQYTGWADFTFVSLETTTTTTESSEETTTVMVTIIPDETIQTTTQEPSGTCDGYFNKIID